MASYDDFLSRVLPEVPGCAEITALQAIKDATIEFCEKSLIYQADHDPVSVAAKTADYDLDSPVADTRIIKIMKLWYSGNELAASAPDQVSDPTLYNQQVGDYSTQYGTPRTFVQKDSETFSLFPIPERQLSNAITMRVALAPLRSATSCADFLFEQFVEPIAAGAVSRLQMTPNKAYSNPKLAGYYQGQYMVGVNDARQKATRGFTRANLSVQMRRI